LPWSLPFCDFFSPALFLEISHPPKPCDLSPQAPVGLVCRFLVTRFRKTNFFSHFGLLISFPPLVPFFSFSILGLFSFEHFPSPRGTFCLLAMYSPFLLLWVSFTSPAPPFVVSNNAGRLPFSSSPQKDCVLTASGRCYSIDPSPSRFGCPPSKASAETFCAIGLAVPSTRLNFAMYSPAVFKFSGIFCGFLSLQQFALGASVFFCVLFLQLFFFSFPILFFTCAADPSAPHSLFLEFLFFSASSLPSPFSKLSAVYFFELVNIFDTSPLLSR